MKAAIRTAALAVAAAFAIVLPARADGPAAVAQIEIRGLDALFSAADCIAAPYVPAGQAKGMFIGACNARAVNPFEVVDGEGTVRVVVYGVDDDWDVLLDFPAAGGDAAGVLGKLEGAMPAADVPAGVVLPEGALSLRNGGFSGALWIPRGERIALVPHTAFAHEIRDVDGAFSVLDAAPAVPAGGVLAAAVDFKAVLPLLAKSRAGTSGARMHELLSDSAFPARALAYGIGLDGADRFRADCSVAYDPDTTQARIASGIGAPVSALANAILFPDAVAAGTYRQELSGISDGEFRAFLVAENGLAAIAGEEDPRAAAARDAMAAASIPFFRMLGDEYALAYLPAGEGEASGGSALLAFPADPQAALDGVPECFNGVIGAFVDVLVSAAKDAKDAAAGEVPDVIDALFRIRVEPAGERTVQETPVRRYVVRLEGEGDTPAREFGAFDAAASGSALYLGTLPEGRLGEVLADLAAGHTAKGPVAAMPAFAAAYGEAPEGASCGFVRLRPALRAVLPSLEAFVNAVDGDDAAVAKYFLKGLSPFAADPDLPEMTLAFSQRWNPDGGRLESVVSMPLADLHAAIYATLPRHGPAGEITGWPAASPAGKAAAKH